MKSLKYILCAAAAVSLAACDFFESNSPSAVDGSVVFSSADSTEMVIAAVYEQFGNDRGYRNRLACGYQGVNTDAEFCTKNSGKAEWAIYNMTPVNGDLSNAAGKDPWGYFNIAIEKCNNIIEGVEEFGDKNNAKSQYLLGEAYFLRSFCYLEMVKFWGDVPPRFTSIAKDPEGLDMKKADRTLVLEHLRGDLKRAAELMPWSSDCPGNAQNNVGRPSKAAALALLMRSDLMYAGKGVRPATWQNGPEWLTDEATRKELYEEVLWAARQILGEGRETSKLQANYQDIFVKICQDEMNYYNTEVLWEIPFTDGARGQVLQYNCPKMSDAVGGLKNNKGGSSNSALGIVPTLYYDFEDGDTRRDVTMQPSIWVYDNGTKFNSSSDKVMQAFPDMAAELAANSKTKFLYQKQQSVADWYGAKYRVEWMKRERTGNDDGVDYPIIRMADVMLMAAEATLGDIQEGGTVKPGETYGIDGQSLLNQIRARAGVGNVELNAKNIMEERKLEFTGEYIRKFDLMRWGILHTTLVAAKARLEQMDKHAGEFAGLQDTIYFKYKRCDDFAMDGVKGFVIDHVYGLKKGETGTPAEYDSAEGWVKTCIYESSSDGRQLASANFVLYNYDEEECLLGRQYWPIFGTNVGASNGALWNDYLYK